MVLPSNLETVQGDGAGFARKWQQILSTFHSSERSTASAISETVLGDQRSTSSAKSAVTFKPRSAGQGERHLALLDGLNVDEFNPPGIPESWERNVATINRISNSAADSNQRGNRNGDERISAKSLHPEGPDGKKSTETRHIDIPDAMVPAATSEPFGQPANLLTAASRPEKLTPWSSPAEFGHRSAPTNHCDALPVGSPSLVPGEHIKADEQIDMEGADIAGTSPGSSFDSPPTLMMQAAHDEVSASVNAVALFVQRGTPGRYNLDIKNARELDSSSILETRASNPIDRASTAECNEGLIFQTPPLAQQLKTSITQRPSIGVRDTVSDSRATMHSFSSTVTSVVPGESMPAFIASREESSASLYARANSSQIGVVTSNELTDRFGKASEVFGAIDERGPTSQWTLAGSHRAEAGFQDPSLGWVSVRAQAGADGIHAVVIPVSDAAGQVLNMHLAGLNAHMTTQYEHLNPVTLASPDAGLHSRDAAENSAQHHGGGGNQSEAQQSQENSQLPRTDTVQSASSPMVRMAIRSVEAPAIIAGQNPGEQHVSVIV